MTHGANQSTHFTYCLYVIIPERLYVGIIPEAAQKRSIRLLKALIMTAATTSAGRLFHFRIIQCEKKISTNASTAIFDLFGRPLFLVLVLL